jgi:hypothetical protein
MLHLKILFHNPTKAVVESKHLVYDGTNHTECTRKPRQQRVRLTWGHVYEHAFREDQGGNRAV